MGLDGIVFKDAKQYERELREYLAFHQDTIVTERLLLRRWKLSMTQDLTTYFVWIGGSCDYGHKGRAGAAVVIEQNGKIISKDVIADLHAAVEE